jgi:hypothetical protein
MRTFIFAISIFLCTVMSGYAQISLVGASINSTTGSVDIVKWQALDSSTITTYPSIRLRMTPALVLTVLTPIPLRLT